MRWSADRVSPWPETDGPEVADVAEDSPTAGSPRVGSGPSADAGPVPGASARRGPRRRATGRSGSAGAIVLVPVSGRVLTLLLGGGTIEDRTVEHRVGRSCPLRGLR
ncbi:hypothetical protein ACFFX0_08885 [Citricoccus parietis]|uniref:Uncharacterized protein n=1 Tax=Citricoccus parietis TaxID=592307 RepID=A0ABV5FXB7_9MICC